MTRPTREHIEEEAIRRKAIMTDNEIDARAREIAREALLRHDSRGWTPDAEEPAILAATIALRESRDEIEMLREELAVIQRNAMNEGMSPHDFRYTTERRARRALGGSHEQGTHDD